MMLRRAWSRGRVRIIYAVVAVVVYVPFALVVEHAR